MQIEGLFTRFSPLAPQEVVTRLKAAIAKAGMTLFAHIDHAGSAHAVDLPMAPMDLLIFGAPKAGTPLMVASPTIGIDLPLKVLVWQDSSHRTCVAFNDPAWQSARHQPPPGLEKIIEAMTHAQDTLAVAAGLQAQDA